ncbi:MAG: carboxymuconolactone decarboxylase family protein [Thermodesulfobacteriota bacterium]
MSDLIAEADELFKNLSEDVPKPVNSFMNFVKTAKTKGVLDSKTKTLICVSLAVAQQCTWCIAVHVKNAVNEGAGKEEILDAAMMAVVMGGGPKIMYLKVLYDELNKYFE